MPRHIRAGSDTVSSSVGAASSSTGGVVQDGLSERLSSDVEDWQLMDDTLDPRPARPSHRRQLSEKLTAQPLRRPPLARNASRVLAAGSSGTLSSSTSSGAVALDGLASLELAPLSALLSPGGPAWSQLDISAQLNDATLRPLQELTTVASGRSLAPVDPTGRTNIDALATINSGTGAPAAAHTAAEAAADDPSAPVPAPTARRDSVIVALQMDAAVEAMDDGGEEVSTDVLGLAAGSGRDVRVQSESVSVPGTRAGMGGPTPFDDRDRRSDSISAGSGGEGRQSAISGRDRASTSSLMRTISGFLNLNEDAAGPTLAPVLYVRVRD